MCVEGKVHQVIVMLRININQLTNPLNAVWEYSINITVLFKRQTGRNIQRSSSIPHNCDIPLSRPAKIVTVEIFKYSSHF